MYSLLRIVAVAQGVASVCAHEDGRSSPELLASRRRSASVNNIRDPDDKLLATIAFATAMTLAATATAVTMTLPTTPAIADPHSGDAIRGGYDESLGY
ncbi:hypothetical protein NM688_g7643 [Phlebia brevispora]|uniref:Uncharacterized protein n=1 Tax=Phlebia brevispora TaxID=194682 RepID=A0ACC1S2X9_9APHY|nr:hypothetical protein NM688_g7643 [Phlebia brevispora]